MKNRWKIKSISLDFQLSKFCKTLFEIQAVDFKKYKKIVHKIFLLSSDFKKIVQFFLNHFGKFKFFKKKIATIFDTPKKLKKFSQNIFVK